MKTTGVSILPLLVALAFASGPSPDALAGEIEVRALNRGSSGAVFVFSPELVRIEPGDLINFVAVDKGHEVHSVAGMIPEGAQPFAGGMNQDVKATFSVPGVYVVACKPHMPMGMLAVVVVGSPVNLDKIDPATLTGKARSKLESLLASLR